MMTTSNLIFVTGGTGFLARHTILRLLAKNYRVRTSLRSPARNAQLRSVLAAAGANVGNLETIQADLMDAACWPEALAGVSHVLHMASPMQGSDILAAALDGTRHVLKASAKAEARRIVLTSSGLAALHPARKVDAGGRVDDADWTDTDRARLDDYARAKTLAEREAWRLASEYNLRLTSLLPGAIVGPALGPGTRRLVGSGRGHAGGENADAATDQAANGRCPRPGGAAHKGSVCARGSGAALSGRQRVAILS